MIDDFTLILPIRERVQYIPRFLRFHAGYRILVIDSSVERHDDLFKGADNVEYHWFGPTRHFEKIEKALDLTQSKYVLLATDDDFFLENGIRDCIRILDSMSGVICAHGANVNFEETPRPNIKYRNHKTLLRNWKLARRPRREGFFERFSGTFDYLSYSPYNATFRRDDLKKVIPKMLEYGFDKPGANDLGFAFVVATLGDYLGSRELYCLKCIDAPSVRTMLQIPMVDFWEQLLSAEALWSQHCDPQKVRDAIPVWKAQIARQARIEGLMGRIAARLFPLEPIRLLANYRKGHGLLDRAVSHG